LDWIYLQKWRGCTKYIKGLVVLDFNHWFVYFDPRLIPSSKAPIWVKLSSLPIEFWLEKEIKDLRDFIGRILDVDLLTD